MIDALRSDRLGVLRICLVVFVVASAIYSASPPVADNDLWGHVYFGRTILTTERLPATNDYSYTAPSYPWINHEVFAECIFAGVYDRFGSPGLLVLKLLLGLATALLISHAASRRVSEPLCWAVGVTTCVLLMSWGYLVRPQLFTFLGLAFLWERLGQHERSHSWRSIVWLPLLFAVWVNLHGGVLAGIGVFWIYALAALPRITDPTERVALVGIAMLCLLSLLMNPYGIRLPLFLVDDLSRSRPISEWMPIPLFDTNQLLFKAVVASLLAGLLLNRRTMPAEAAVISIAALLTFRHQRHLPLFAVLASPFLAETLESAAQKAVELGFPRLTAASRLLLGAAVLAVAAFEVGRVLGIYRDLRWQIFVSPEIFPVGAVSFIQRNDLAGDLVLPFDWGEYAIWHLYPRCRVNVDGRYTTAYPDAVLAESNRFDHGTAGWEAALTNASIALIRRTQPIVRAMFAKHEWVYVYSDDTALVFVRRDVAGAKSFERRPQPDAQGMPFFP